ncbi:MAG: aminotransferase class I/II-fold pyridoxal phosphate-dependent enzyme [Clostridia bacterium]|nr:aminotransferase class I/II-fold pyridoxal phosphate-dependent enzyme [Clostridia bacterium]
MFDYESCIPSRIRDIKPSGIRKFFDLVSERRDVISLTVGEPDFVTPWHIRVAGIESLESGKTYYTANSGMTKLREAISDYLARRFDAHYDPLSEVVVTVGGSEAIDIAFRAMLEPGDEVIIPEPTFVCYEPLSKLAGGTPVIIRTKAENKFRLTAEELRAAITPKTKMLVLPYPNNPTGAILTREDLTAIAEVLEGTKILVLSDEIYAELTYGRQHCSCASVPGLKERTILVSGFSKAFAMTGWRLGYLCAPKPLCRQMLKLHQYAIMCAPTTAQFAAIEAMTNGDEDVARMREEYNRRRRYLTAGLRRIGLPCFEPEGAFYVFPDVSGFGLTSEQFCERLLNEHNVAIVPGNAFGESGEGFARISYAYSVEHIEKALSSMEAFTKKLQK